MSQAFFLEQLLDKYPVVWQGSLSLKNDAALLQFHFLSGMLLFYVNFILQKIITLFAMWAVMCILIN